MKRLPRICTADVVIHGVVKLSFLDGFEGVVDLRPIIAKGKIFDWLQDSEHFADFRVDPYGHSLSWTDDSGYDIDFGADSLRRDCERQAQIHQLMVG